MPGRVGRQLRLPVPPGIAPVTFRVTLEGATHARDLASLATVVRVPETLRVGDGRTAPRDAGGIAQWGRLDARTNGEVKFRVRSGATARPDATWSAWTNADLLQERHISPQPMRQCRATMRQKPGRSREILLRLNDKALLPNCL